MHKELDTDVIENYAYDLGYFEGVRENLMTLQRILHTFANTAMTEEEKLSHVLKEFGEIVDDALNAHKDSERAYIQMDADLNFNRY